MWLSISAASRLLAVPMAWKSPAGRPALDAETRPEARLAQADHRLLADPVEPVAEAHGGRRLAFSGRRGRDGRDQDELAVRPVLEAVDEVERHLGLMRPVAIEVLIRDADLAGDHLDRPQGRGPGNLDVAADLLRHPRTPV